ncbi:MAG TPA: LuxR C-terminal-related transcriptional regulator, partial [Ktedonobacterales bacterium]|nr:LuxR C-terminal-related transcriptional regulator [Ktedonobacterales bacterium]
TPFIGRTQERAAACQALTAARMLTLWGAGGSGKTQLAIQVAGDLRTSYPDGIHIVELATVSEPSQIAQAVAVALGIHEERGRALSTSLATWLGTQRLLLVLDNCEHLIDACAQLGGELLGACPRIGILITSRGPASDEPGAQLRLPSSEPLFGTTQRGCALGGAALRLPSLALPALNPLPTLSHLRENESVRLFCEHAALSQPGFALTQENARSVAEICARLDGIPLAIELAATRVKLLDVARIADRLDDCFALLPARSGRLPRRKTLHETIGWSYELLKGQARTLFRRLAIFAGGWDIEAAEAICTGCGIQRSHVLRLLESLVNAALVEVETQNAERRYRFLEPIRQYAEEKLRDAREADWLRQRHATWFQALAQHARPHLTSAQQQTWLLRLKAEYGNLLAALRWTSTHCSAEVGLWLSSAMWRLWYNRGQLSEGYTWLEAMLAREPGASLEYRRARIAALYAAGHLAMVRGDLDVAQAAAEECLALAEKLGDRLSMSDAYSLLGGVAEYRDQLPQSLTLHELSLALARQLGARPEDKRRVALSLSNLADVLAKQHDLVRAEALYAEGLALFHSIEDLRGIAMSQTNLGRISHWLGHAELAIQNLEESAMRFRALDDLRGVGDAVATRALVAYEQRDYMGALARYDEAAEIYARAQCRILVVESLEGIARVMAALNKPAQATRILGAADGQRAAMAARRHQMDDEWYAPVAATLRKRLGAATFTTTYASGRALPLDEAVAAAHALVAQAAPANERATRRRAKSPRAKDRSELLSQPLTPREQEVLRLLRQGLSKIEIAARFDRSTRTVDTHMGHIYAKLGVSSRDEAIAAWEGRRELVREMSRAELRPGIRER